MIGSRDHKVHLLRTLFFPLHLRVGAPPHSQTEEKLLIDARNDRRNGQREDGGSEEDVDGLKEAAQLHGRPGQQECGKAQGPL